MDENITAQAGLIGFPKMEQAAITAIGPSELKDKLNELFAQGWRIVAGTIVLQPETRYTHMAAFAVVEREIKESE